MPASPAIRAIGRIAHAALLRSGGRFDRLPGGGGSSYASAAGEIIWIGHGDVAMHPRAVLLDRAVFPTADHRLHPGPLTPWRPAPAPERVGVTAPLRIRCDALRRDILRFGAPQGFAPMLFGGAPAFPLDRAALCVRLLARACRDRDAEALHDAALPLLGLGPGLTPSGDDLVGALLFVRQAITTSFVEAQALAEVATRLCAASEARSHPIGAALFRDLANGESFAPLHRLVAALTEGGDPDALLHAARELVAIGHSSGWDMLTGCIVGLTGRVDPMRDAPLPARWCTPTLAAVAAALPPEGAQFAPWDGPAALTLPR